MRVNIQGLTGVTITFNTLGIVLRGEKTAKSIDIKNDEQMRELVSMKNANLISFESDEVPLMPEVKISTTLPKPIAKVLDNSAKNLKKGIASEPVNLPQEDDNSVEDAPSPVVDKDAEKEDEVTVMTAAGPVKGKMVNNMAGDVPESEATRLSIEALRQMDEEEAKETEAAPVDESKLDASERMGGKATIATGARTTTNVSMKNSLLPEAEQVRKAAKFITEEAPVTTDKDDVSDAFIEM